MKKEEDDHYNSKVRVFDRHGCEQLTGINKIKID